MFVDDIPSAKIPERATVRAVAAVRAVAVLGLVLVSLLMACAHQPDLPRFVQVPGFLHGLWHGLIAPFALVGSLFADVRMYAFPNSGPWYDFGFLLGIAVWGGGGAAARR